MKSQHLVRVAVALFSGLVGGQQASAQMGGMPVMTPGAAPHYFSAANYANSPLPVISGAVVAVGNPLIQRQYATDVAGAQTLVVVPTPLPTGMLQGINTWNQTVPGAGTGISEANVFNAYVLRPTLVAGEYLVVYDSGPLTVPMAMNPLGEVASFPVPNIAVQTGDVLAYYGAGVPYDADPAGTDRQASPAPAAPVAGALITLGSAAFPLAPPRNSSFAASVFDQSGANVVVTGGIRKFVDGLPGLGAGAANNLGQYIPVAVADTTTYPGTDYYEIAVVQYQEKMHTDLPPTTLRGYVQLSTNVVPGGQLPLVNVGGSPILLPNGSQAVGVDKPHYLGPMIVATKDRPVRILFRNLLPTGLGGNLFIPVDTTVMGAGMGPDMNGMADPDPLHPMCGMIPKPIGCYTENRATLHLHGGISPWISDGTPHQWITPAGENTAYPKGVSVQNVPDMPDPGPGAQTFFYTNQQSARLMFYHDHAWGITRLNVYSGEAAAYLIADPVEQGLVASGVLPADQIPLVIQDKTFVPGVAQLASQDPTWDLARWGGFGQLWVPHVYSPAQNPGDVTGVNAFGRWAYGPWFWPPTTGINYGPIANPYYDPLCDPNVGWCEPPQMPGTPYLSMGMEAFNDTPLVNGTVYPTITVQPKSYRLRILNAANDRFFNLQLYVADATGKEVALKAAEVAAALANPNIFPTPDTVASPPGPSWIQIGTEGGFLPTPVVVPPQPITWVIDPTRFDAGNVDLHSLLLGPAERADVVVDFSAFAGKTLILYNDAPAAFPARDPRYDYYTGNADLTASGGAPSTIPGYGPNTRTIMQVVVAPATPAAPYNLAALQTAFKATSLGGQGVFQSSQHPIIVGQGAYNQAYGTTFASAGTRAGLVHIYDGSLSFDTLAGVPLVLPLQRKAIHDEMGASFDQEYGRMSGNLGLEITNPVAGVAQNVVLYPYVNPSTELFDGIELPPGVSVTPISTTTDGTQIWKITHNGVDTHPIHFHLVDVQVINRVGWDGIIRKPALTELGWKDTVRISPLEDTIVAMRPIIPKLPFGVVKSQRPLNPMMPLGSTANFVNIDANANPLPAPITNVMTDFGWEYVWHCHILSHEEMDMMRPLTVAVNVVAPGTPIATATPNANQTISLNWIDGTPINYATLAAWGDPSNEVGFRIERGVADAGGNVATWTQIGTALANVTSFTDANVTPGVSYRYRVIAWNAAGETVSLPATATMPVPTPATGLTVTANATSPFNIGQNVTFTATGTGSTTGGAPTPSGMYQYQFYYWNGVTSTLVKPYSQPGNSWTLTTSSTPGTYRVTVYVRTTTSVWSDKGTTYNFSVVNFATTPTPATGLTLTANAANPFAIGQSVTFTATGSGSTTGGSATPAATYQYEFYYWNGTTSTLVKPYSQPGNTWTMAASSTPGSFRVTANVRTTSSVSLDKSATYSFYVVDPATTPTPATGLTVTSSATSPFAPGQSVTFTATGSGSTTGGTTTSASTYQYQFYYWDGTTSTLVKSYSQPGNSWTLTAANTPGSYRVTVYVRTTSFVWSDKGATVNFQVQ